MANAEAAFSGQPPASDLLALNQGWQKLRKGSPLSGHDGRVITMGCVLELTYGKGSVVILTTDRRIVDVCSHKASDPNSDTTARNMGLLAYGL